MKTFVKWILLNILTIGVLAIFFPAVSVRAEEADSAEKAKVIAVVLDDSTSMVRDDPGTDEEDYTTRWEEADYAIRALAATMDAGDVLKVYPLNGAGFIEVKIGTNGLDSQESKNLKVGLSKMKYYGATPIDRVEAVADDLRKTEGKDCFLIVITDGNFKQENAKGEKGKGDDLTQNELTKKFNNILKDNPDLQVKYLQIGKNEGNKFPDNSNVAVYSNTSGDITTEITEVINEIYNRVGMSEEDKEELIDNKTENKITINFDIPVKNVTVFMQAMGKEEDVFQEAQYSGDAYNVFRTDIDVMEKNISELWKSEEKYNEDWICRKELKGAVFRFSSAEGSMEPITIDNVANISNDSIQVYYEPAIEQRITVKQNRDDSFICGEDSDNIFVEGTVEFRIEYFDFNGNLLDVLDKEGQPVRLLRADGVKVTLDEELTGKNDKGIYVYSDSLESGDSDKTLIVSNEIGLYGGRRKIPLGTIYEPYVDLAVELEEKEPTLVLDTEGKAMLNVLVRDTKTGELITKKWKDRITLGLESQYFKADSNNCIYNTDGSISIPISVKDVNRYQFSGNETESFAITATGIYDDKTRNPEKPGRMPVTTGKVNFNVRVTSKEHHLFAQMDEAEIEMFHSFLFGEKIPLTYLCDGDILSGENRELLTAELITDDSLPDGLVALTGDAVELKKHALGWMSLRNSNCTLSLKLSCTKWNRDVQSTISLPLKLLPFTKRQWVLLVVGATIMALILAVAVFFVIWCAWLSGKREDYIKKNTEFQLKMVGGSEENNIEIYWVWWRWLLFRMRFWGGRYAHVGIHSSGDKENKALSSEIDLYIRRIDEGWKLEKLEQIRPPVDMGHLVIGGKRVSEENCRFSVEETKELEIIYNGDKRKMFIE